MENLVLLSHAVLKSSALHIQHETVIDSVAHNECALALDLLCDYIIEYKVTISDTQLNEIKVLSKEFAMGSIKVPENSFRLLEQLAKPSI